MIRKRWKSRYGKIPDSDATTAASAPACDVAAVTVAEEEDLETWLISLIIQPSVRRNTDAH